MTGTQLMLKIERHVKAAGKQMPHGVGGDGRLPPVVGTVGPGGGDRPLEFARRILSGLRFKLRQEPGDAVGVLRLPGPRLDAVTHVSFSGPVCRW